MLYLLFAVVAQEQQQGSTAVFKTQWMLCQVWGCLSANGVGHLVKIN